MTRRGMYGAVSRVFPNEFQTLFDYPLPTLSAESRYTTNVALQGLFFLNSDIVRKQAAAMAERVKGAGNEEAQVRAAFRIAYQRDPSVDELTPSVELLHEKDPTPDSGNTRAGDTPRISAFDAKPDATSATVKPETPATPATKSKELPLQALCWGLLSSNEFLFLN
jgi:hypothetical protein